MREILFRGKRTDNGEWVEGADIMHDTIRGKLCIADVGKDWISVDPETAGQFTGLTDENGVKIFEGDIVEIKDFSEGANFYKQPTSIWIVKWYEQRATFGLNYMVPIRYNYFADSKVLGNIYDNPERLAHGKWRCLRYKKVVYECSKCKRWFDVKSKFCPYCDAMMDGGDTNA